MPKPDMETISVTLSQWRTYERTIRRSTCLQVRLAVWNKLLVLIIIVIGNLITSVNRSRSLRRCEKIEAADSIRENTVFNFCEKFFLHFTIPGVQIRTIGVWIIENPLYCTCCTFLAKVKQTGIVMIVLFGFLHVTYKHTQPMLFYYFPLHSQWRPFGHSQLPACFQHRSWWWHGGEKGRCAGWLGREACWQWLHLATKGKNPSAWGFPRQQSTSTCDQKDHPSANQHLLHYISHHLPPCYIKAYQLATLCTRRTQTLVHYRK